MTLFARIIELECRALHFSLIRILRATGYVNPQTRQELQILTAPGHHCFYHRSIPDIDHLFFRPYRNFYWYDLG